MAGSGLRSLDDSPNVSRSRDEGHPWSAITASSIWICSPPTTSTAAQEGKYHCWWLKINLTGKTGQDNSELFPNVNFRDVSGYVPPPLGKFIHFGSLIRPLRLKMFPNNTILPKYHQHPVKICSFCPLSPIITTTITIIVIMVSLSPLVRVVFVRPAKKPLRRERGVKPWWFYYSLNLILFLVFSVVESFVLFFFIFYA